jgi:hypothetical protein
MVKPATLIRQYKQHSSDFASWDQKGYAQHWLVFPENMGANLAIDEVSLSNGELWTFLTNKAGKGRKGTLVAAIRGTRTTDIEQARASGVTYRSEELVNGDTPKQLLARCRFALMKYESQITDKNQWLRLRVAFHRYPELERAFNHAQRLRSIFNHKSRANAEQELDDWIHQTIRYGHETFASAANSIRWHKDTILNFFDNRATNASAESFNARIKLFRANQKGVRDTTFFLFRLSKLYA